MSVFCNQEDGYNLDFDSDDAPSCSSDSGDDDTAFFARVCKKHGKKKVPQRDAQKNENDDEDDFEKEMNLELNQTIKDLEQRRKSEGSESCVASTSGGASSQGTQPEYYDDVYFESDSDSDSEKGVKRPKKSKHQVVSNDDLLYDPDADDDNQRWVDKMRRSHQPKTSTKSKPAPASDAVLNCPACMVTLCVDCQRHDIYKNQYRAMFVMNCTVIAGEVLKYPQGESKKNRKRKNQAQDKDSASNKSERTDSDVSYHPVKCSECTTEVGVIDKDEVYHFFNVLASYA